MNRRTQTYLGLLSFVVVLAWFFHESIFLGWSLLPADILHQLILPYARDVKHISIKYHYCVDVLSCFYPNCQFWQSCVRHGEWPLWNPHIFGGHPLLAASMQTVLSPFKLPYLLLPAERAFTLGIVLQFLVGGVGMFLFLREIGRSAGAAFVGCCAFVFSNTFVLGYWFQPSMFGLTPLVLLLYERALRQSAWRVTWLAGLTLGVAFLSANIQAAIHLLFLCLIYFTGSIVAADAAARRQRILRVAAILVIGLLVGLVQWLPTIELAQQGILKQVVGRTHNQPSLRNSIIGLPLLLSFIFPGLAGSPETFDLTKLIGTSLGEYNGYIGMVPFILFVCGAVCAREWRVRALGAVLAGVLFLIFCTPLLRQLYYRFFVVYVFAAAVVAADGMDAVLESTPAQQRRLRWVFIGTLGGCILLVIGLLLAQWVVHIHYDALLGKARHYVQTHMVQALFATQTEWYLARVPLFLKHFRLSNPMFALPILTGLAAAAGWFAYVRQRLTATAFAGLLVFATAVELTTLGRLTLPQTDLQKYPLFPPVKVLAAVQADKDLFRVLQSGSKAGLILPNSTLMSYGLNSVFGNESVWPDNLSSLPVRTDAAFNRLLDLENVKYLVTDDDTVLPAGRFDLVTAAEGLRLYRNNDCLPRLFVVQHWQVETNQAAILALMTRRDFNPGATVFLEDSPTLIAAPATNSPGPSAVQVASYQPHRIVARVRTATPGLLVLTDTFYPGWTVTVDGAPQPLQRADCVLRAVAVPAGQHTVEFAYAPRPFRLGLAISGLTIGLVLLAIAWSYRARACR